MNKRPWMVPVAFLLIYVIWGSTYLAIDHAIRTLPPFLMAGIRFLLAGAVLYGIARLMGAPKPEKGEWRPAAIVGLFLLLGGNGGVVLAQKTVPSGLAALLVAGTAIWMTLFAALRPGGAWPRWQAWIGLLGGLGGVALLIGPWGPERVEPFGAACLLAATLAWSTGSIYAKGARLPKSPFIATAVEMMAGGAALLAVGAAMGQYRGFDPGAVSTASILAFAYLAVFGSIVAFTAYVWLLSVRPASMVATYAYVNPVVAVALGSLFNGETLTPRMIVAAGFIVVSVALITTFSHSKPKAPLPAAEVTCERA